MQVLLMIAFQTHQRNQARLRQEDHEADLEFQLPGEYQPVHCSCEGARRARRRDLPIGGPVRWQRPLLGLCHFAVPRQEGREVAQHCPTETSLQGQDHQPVSTIAYFGLKAISDHKGDD